MSNPNLGHERQITFFPSNGHNHNGENSSPVELVPGQVGWQHLDPSLLELIENAIGSGGSANDTDGLVPIPDLEIETNSIAAGGTLTGSIDWTGVAVVRFMRIVMSVETECTITFYHKATYADEDREFRARRCSNKFLWEGPWVHWDEDETNKIHYKIQNTGTASAQFNITLKAGTLVANAYANFVSGIAEITGEPLIGNVIFREGNGINITKNEDDNSFTFEAVAPEAVTINRMALVPMKHTSFTSSTTTTNSGSGLNSYISTSNYVNFGSGPQYIQADFGEVVTAGRIVATPYPDMRVYYDVKIEVSVDGVNWSTVLSQQNAASPQTGITVEFLTGYPVRYVRFWSNGSSANTSNHLSGLILYKLSDKVGT